MTLVSAEDRFLSSLHSMLGAAVQEDLDKEAEEVTEKVAEEPAKEPVVEQADEPITKIAEMSMDDIFENEHFLRGVSDRIAQRGHEIQAALEAHIAS